MKYLTFIILFFTSLTLSQNINDPHWDTQYWLRAMNVHHFWQEANTYGDANVVVAVLGLGVEITHEDLADNIWVNNEEIPGNGIDDDENGYIDDYNGGNVIDNNGNVLPSHDNEIHAHETRVSGIIAAVKNNNKGITGIAPGCKILPVKFYESSQTHSWWAEKLIAAFNYVRNLQLRFSEKRFIINLSYGWDLTSAITFSSAEVDEITYAIEECYNLGIPVFCSAGNDHADPVSFPASLPFTNSVAELDDGTDNEFNLKGFNNIGPENTFAAAGCGSKITSYNNDYHPFSGTSFSTPVATGIAALLLSVKNDLTPSQIRNIMISTTNNTYITGVNFNWNPQMPGHSIELGYGKLDALKCYQDGFLLINFANNVEGNTTDFGQIKVNDTWCPTNTSLPFVVKDEISVESENILHYYNGYNNRYYNWNYFENSNYSRQHHNIFSATWEASEVEALYKKTKSLTIRNYLEGGSADQIWFGEYGVGSIPGDFQLRNSGYSANTFIYNYDANVKLTYKAEAKENIQNVLNTNWKFVKWENSSTNRIREEQINQNTSSEWRAMYKGIQRTDYVNAFSNNSQRKIVRTPANTVFPNGVLHSVYESLDKVWYEISTDNGSTWQSANNGNPLSINDSKLPSLDFRIHQTPTIQHIVIVYQERYYSVGSKIKLKWYSLENGSFTFINEHDIITSLSLTYGFNTKPVIALLHDNKLVVVWKGLTELKYWAGELNSIGTITSHEIGTILETSADSDNPSISVMKELWDVPAICHLVWSDYETSINYTSLSLNTNNQVEQGDIYDISRGSGYTKNYNPTIVSFGVPNYPSIGKIAWIGKRGGYEEGGGAEPTEPEYRVVFTSSDLADDPRHWVFGNDVGSPSINKTDNNSSFVFAWSQFNGAVTCFADENLMGLYQMQNLTGKDLHLSNGTNKSSMYASALNLSSLPYYFLQSANIQSYYNPQMEKSQLVAITNGREGIVCKDTAQFYFCLGDIILNGEPVDFIDINDTTVVNSLQTVNLYLNTKPFTLTNTSSLSYSVQYGITDSMAAVNVLQNNLLVNFKVELVDANTGEVLGVFDNITYEMMNIFQYDNISYSINTNGIGNRTVKLRLVLNDNIDASYSLSKKFAFNNVISKKQIKEISYKGSLAVTDYALSQNYPNPFNPVTTINYQIPKDGFVSLKVYDILGKEIVTLVNSDKVQGRYTVEFDGSRFASGMYIYKLQSGDFVETRKMMLLK